MAVAGGRLRRPVVWIDLMSRYCPKCLKSFPPGVDLCPDHRVALVTFADRDLTGQSIDDRYRVIRKVGKGGMGVVYEAIQLVLNRRLALKVLNRELVKDEVSVKRFLNEARAMASLRCPHTITLYDFGATGDGLLFYTMELLDGRPLSAILRKEGPLRHERAVTLVLQCCDSLEEAHEKGILHRDIKPDNLFVIEDRKIGEFVKVLDFGIAKLMGDTSMESLTKTGMVCGTPDYLSPEQVLGNPPVPSSDLYSLAIVLYELLAGQPPFKGTTAMKVLMKHLNELPEPIEMKNPDVRVPKALEEFIQRGLAKNPAARFASVPEFRDALEKAASAHRHKPETVSLPPLSTTGQGVRIITDSYAPDSDPLLDPIEPNDAANSETCLLTPDTPVERPDAAPVRKEQSPPPSPPPSLSPPASASPSPSPSPSSSPSPFPSPPPSAFPSPSPSSSPSPPPSLSPSSSLSPPASLSPSPSSSPSPAPAVGSAPQVPPDTDSRYLDDAADSGYLAVRKATRTRLVALVAGIVVVVGAIAAVVVTRPDDGPPGDSQSASQAPEEEAKATVQLKPALSQDILAGQVPDATPIQPSAAAVDVTPPPAADVVSGPGADVVPAGVGDTTTAAATATTADLASTPEATAAPPTAADLVSGTQRDLVPAPTADAVPEPAKDVSAPALQDNKPKPKLPKTPASPPETDKDDPAARKKLETGFQLLESRADELSRRLKWGRMREDLSPEDKASLEALAGEVNSLQADVGGAKALLVGNRLKKAAGELDSLAKDLYKLTSKTDKLLK